MAPARVTPQIGRMKTFPAAMLALLAAFSCSAQAQDSGWHSLVEPYIMFPNMKGETGVGNLPLASVDEDPSDIFDNLQMGAMLYFEVRNESWAFSSDVLYMDLESDLTPHGVISDGKAGVTQLGWELAAMRRVTPWLEVGVSAVYNKIDADVDITTSTILGTTTRSAGLSEDWIDPTLVARATFPFGTKWSGQLRANLGGFGVGSDLFWQIQADVVYRQSDKWQFAFGYRVIDFDYDHGSGTGRFVYDMQNFGPVLKLGYSF